MSRRARQSERIHERRIDARAQAARDGTLDQIFGGPVSLVVVASYLHRLGSGEIEPTIVIADHVAHFVRV